MRIERPICTRTDSRLRRLPRMSGWRPSVRSTVVTRMPMNNYDLPGADWSQQHGDTSLGDPTRPALVFGACIAAAVFLAVGVWMGWF